MFVHKMWIEPNHLPPDKLASALRLDVVYNIHDYVAPIWTVIVLLVHLGGSDKYFSLPYEINSGPYLERHASEPVYKAPAGVSSLFQSLVRYRP